MEWYIFAGLCALFGGISSIIEKKTLRKQHAMEFSTVLAIFNFIIVLPLIINADFSQMTLKYYFIIFGVSCLGSVAFLLVAKSLRHMEISQVSPLLNFGPVFVAILAFFFLGERITGVQMSGILLLILGSYILEINHGFQNILDPIRNMFNSRHTIYIFIALLLYAFSSLGDKIILGAISPITYIIVVQFFLAVNFIVMITVFHDGIAGIRRGIKNAGHWILVVAILTTSYRLFQAQAISMVFLSLVIPIKRTSTLISTIIGGELFHEDGLLKKAIACIVMLLGAYFVIVG
ncbi:MAG: EamA family transporter [Nanohaloarchaea archaeon]|nr:EamA family transporter [Candidatus Nanohaloarchaea archaeon]